MGKSSTVIYITVALLLLFLVSRSPNKHSNYGHGSGQHRRLKLRSSFNFGNPTHHEPVPFDPVVAEIERRREDRQWERQYFEHHHPELNLTYDPAPSHEAQPEWEDFMNAEDYLNNEDTFNVTNRILLLFPKIDTDPSDGYVDLHELTQWHLQQADAEAMHRTEREMAIHDKNHDGFVSFTEYEPPSWVLNSGNDSNGNEMGWWKEEHFNASDADGDGLLNITEFKEFQHPADSKSQKLLLWLCREEVSERDSDKDGKVSFEEFFHGLFDLVRNYEEEGSSGSHDDTTEAPAKQLFAQLDRDGDGLLSDAELLPIIGKLHPSEHYYAKQQADYILNQNKLVKKGMNEKHLALQELVVRIMEIEVLFQIGCAAELALLFLLKADTDKDGKLTLTEMIDNPYVFYSAIFSDDEDEGDDYHDEFR